MGMMSKLRREVMEEFRLVGSRSGFTGVWWKEVQAGEADGFGFERIPRLNAN